MSRISLAVAVLVGSCLASGSVADEPKTVRVGIIGLDTSHVVAFTSVLNRPNNEGDLAGVKVVAAFPGGSLDIEASRSRVDGFTKDLREKYGVEIVDSIETLLTKVDAVLLESVDGRPHLAQARPVLAAKKPLFIDKPIAASLADTMEIFRLSKATGTPCFSSSSLRFYPGIKKVRAPETVGEVLGCDAYGPCSLEEHHPDLFWYGIHGVETLFTIMGPGCVSVTRAQTKDTEFVTGVWKDGRIGTFRGTRAGTHGYGAVVFGSKGVAFNGDSGSYEPLVVEIVRFFKTGKPPVSAEETLDIVAFMEAADESKRQGGRPVELDTVRAKAEQSLAARN